MIRSSGGRRLLGDSGATVVEFTLVFLFLVLPMTLFGIQLVLNTFIRQQATAAARDGARAGAVAYNKADVNSTNNTKVQNAVKSKLAFTPSNITVRCTGPDVGSNAALGDLACIDAKPDLDRVEVTVTLKTIRITGPLPFFTGPLLPSTISSSASQVVVTKYSQGETP